MQNFPFKGVLQAGTVREWNASNEFGPNWFVNRGSFLPVCDVSDLKIRDEPPFSWLVPIPNLFSFKMLIIV